MDSSRFLSGCVAGLLAFTTIVSAVTAAVVTEWVVVGDPGNAEHTAIQSDGTSGYGRVDYEYRIGRYEVTNGQYTEFLNAVAATDTNELYWTLMGSDGLGGILRNGTSGNYTYAAKPNMGNKPVNFVTWHDAARYTNWLHNGQPIGMQNATTTEDGAYTFIGFETAAPRNFDAQVFIPDEHEWHKAAFYQPGVVTDDGDEWWLYPTASDDLPLQAVADANGDVRNPGPQVVNYFHGAGWNGQFDGNVTTVGSAGNSTYYGAEDMGGNVFEWTTADPNKPDPFGVGPYIVRGASFQNTFGHLKNIERNLGPLSGAGHQHSFASKNNGFRVASYLPAVVVELPEPCTLILVVVGGVAIAGRVRKPSWLALFLATLLFPAFAEGVAADTFGTDANLFDIEFVTIGDPGNAPDTSGDPNPDSPGSVPYGYRIGKHEISEDMIAKAKAEGGLNINITDRGPNKPASLVSWLEATTFVNWLNTSSGNQAAYKYISNNFALWQPGDAGYDSANPYRNSLAKYFLPSADEWYKAAFFDPTTGSYFQYATGSNTAPEPIDSGTDPDTAAYGQKLSTTPPADITLAGGLSPYGTMAQSGNVFELEESDFDLVNDSATSPRGARGGTWAYTSMLPGLLSKSFRNSITPTDQSSLLGFRVAATALTADFDFDGDVDHDDLAKWNTAFGANADGDADGDGDSDGADFLAWQQNFEGVAAPPVSSLASVPEPSSAGLLVLALLFGGFRGRRASPATPVF